MSFSDSLENSLLDHVLGGGDYSRPATVYVALSTTTPNDDGTNFTEPGGGAYARVATTNNATNWPAASDGQKSNGTVITFPQATSAWGTVTHFGIYDASSGGTLLLWGALDANETVSVGETVRFDVGALVVTLD